MVATMLQNLGWGDWAAYGVLVVGFGVTGGIILGAAISGIFGYLSANRSAGAVDDAVAAQVEASMAALALQERMYLQSRADMGPLLQSEYASAAFQSEARNTMAGLMGFAGVPYETAEAPTIGGGGDGGGGDGGGDGGTGDGAGGVDCTGGEHVDNYYPPSYQGRKPPGGGRSGCIKDGVFYPDPNYSGDPEYTEVERQPTPDGVPDGSFWSKDGYPEGHKGRRPPGGGAGQGEPGWYGPDGTFYPESKYGGPNTPGDPYTPPSGDTGGGEDTDTPIGDVNPGGDDDDRTAQPR